MLLLGLGLVVVFIIVHFSFNSVEGIYLKLCFTNIELFSVKDERFFKLFVLNFEDIEFELI